MTDLATRVEATVPLPPDLCAEVAIALGWGTPEECGRWFPPFDCDNPGQDEPPDYNSLDVVLRHTPEGHVWKLIQCEEDWWADLERYLLQGRAYRCSGNAARLANAALAAIIREKVA